jgi:hypothetical protein
MSQDWMIDVLTDIRQYARSNRFPGLTEILDDAIIIAAVELRERGEICSVAESNVNQTGKLHRGVEEY